MAFVTASVTASAIDATAPSSAPCSAANALTAWRISGTLRGSASSSHSKRADRTAGASETTSPDPPVTVMRRTIRGYADRGPLRPGGARIGQRGEARLELLAVRLEVRREDHGGAELLERHVDGEARPVVGDLEQDAAGFAEVDRVEVMAVDDRRRLHPGLAQALVPARMLGDGG